MAGSLGNRTKLQQYLTGLLARHPGLSMRKASLQAGLNENSVQQILKSSHFVPKPQTLKALADKWGTPEDYVIMMRLAGHSIPKNPDIDTLSAVKQRAIRLLTHSSVPDDLAAFVAAGLEAYLREESE